jgi:hypothetical protein
MESCAACSWCAATLMSRFCAFATASLPPPTCRRCGGATGTWRSRCACWGTGTCASSHTPSTAVRSADARIGRAFPHVQRCARVVAGRRQRRGNFHPASLPALARAGLTWARTQPVPASRVRSESCQDTLNVDATRTLSSRSSRDSPPPDAEWTPPHPAGLYAPMSPRPSAAKNTF